MCDEIEPCVDCKWRMLLLRGKPTVAVFCETCRRWFISSHVVYVDEDEVEAKLNGTKEHVNELLRCDAMTRMMVVVRTQRCDYCTGMPGGTTILRVSRENRLHLMIRRLLKRAAEGDTLMYDQAQFPAYTLQRRCGADPELTELYLKMKPDAAEKIEKYQARRKDEQRKFAERHPEIVGTKHPWSI
jgi:hypothetical protein